MTSVVRRPGSGTSTLLLKGILAALAPLLLTGALRRRLARQIAHRKTMPAGATWVQTSRGRTRYLLEGPAPNQAKGRLVVLVHGFIGSSDYFKYLADALIKAGRRVLRYDNHGRGLSDWDGSPNDAALFVGQLRELLAHLQVTEPVDLVGYSMGGAITAAYTAMFPESVASLTLCAPAGANSCFGATAFQKLAQLLVWTPGIEQQIGWKLVASLASSSSYGSNWVQPDCDRLREIHIVERQRAFNEGPTLAMASVSTLRHFPMNDCIDAHKALGAAKTPVLILWGDDDAMCPVEGAEEIRAHVPQAEVKIFKGYKHGFVIEQAEEMCGHMLDFHSIHSKL